MIQLLRIIKSSIVNGSWNSEPGYKKAVRERETWQSLASEPCYVKMQEFALSVAHDMSGRER